MTIERDNKGRFIKGGTKSPKCHTWTKENHPNRKGLTKENDKSVLRQSIKVSRTLKKQYKNGKVHNMLGKENKWGHHTEESKQKIREKRVLQKVAKGKNHCNWIEDRSFLIYPDEFNEELKERIRNKFGRICQLCGKSEEENEWGRLPIHHIDYNKQNCNENNLIPLCVGCNFKVNCQRILWTKYFQNKIMSKIKC